MVDWMLHLSAQAGLLGMDSHLRPARFAWARFLCGMPCLPAPAKHLDLMSLPLKWAM